MSGQLNSPNWILILPLVGAASTLVVGILVPDSPTLLYIVGGTVGGFLLALAFSGLISDEQEATIINTDVPEDYPLTLTIQDSITGELITEEATIRANQTDLDVPNPDAGFTTTTTNGRAELSISSWGDWRIAVEYGTLEEETILTIREPTERILEIGPKTIDVHLESEAGRPLTSVTVTCEPDTGTAEQRHTNTDTHVRFAVSANATEATLHVRDTEHDSTTKTVPIRGASQDVTIPLTASTAHVELTATCDGAPLANTPLTLSNTTDENKPDLQETTDEEGTAVFESVPPGTYELLVSAPELHSFYSIDERLEIDDVGQVTKDLSATFTFSLDTGHRSRIDSLRTQTTSSATGASPPIDTGITALLAFLEDLPNQGAAVAAAQMNPSELVDALLEVTSQAAAELPTGRTPAGTHISNGGSHRDLRIPLGRIAEDPDAAITAQADFATELRGRLDAVDETTAAPLREVQSSLTTFLSDAQNDPGTTRGERIGRALLGQLILDELEATVTAFTDGTATDTASADTQMVESGVLREPPAIPTDDQLAVSGEWLAEADREIIGESLHTVVSSVELSDGATVALKEGESPSGRETLAAQIEAINRWAEIANHDHVVRVHDASRAADPWIAMEYMDAGSLEARLNGDEEVSLAEGIWILRAVADALRHGHHEGVQHFNLTPSNVLFRETTEENWPAPKVSDWDVAEIGRAPNDTPKEIHLAYAAPEQLEEESYGTPGEKTDIYQLGTIIYEVVTGVQAFAPHPTSGRVMQDLQPPLPTHEDEAVPGKLDEICRKAMSVEQNDRYESMDELYEDLDSLYQRF